MKTNLWKSMLSLSVIAIVCAALLIAGSVLLPKQTRKIDYGDYLNDKNAVLVEVAVSSLDKSLQADKATKTEMVSVYKSTEGKTAGGYVFIASSTSDYGTLEMVVGIDNKSNIVKVGQKSVVDKSGFYRYPLTEENYKKFVGNNPLNMKAADLVSTTSATITKNLMLNIVRLSYRAGVALTGGTVEEPSEEVMFARDYFSQDVVDATVVTDLPTGFKENVKVYSVTLADSVKGWIFVDSNVYHKFNLNGAIVDPGKVTSDDENGAFYITETGVGVYEDGGVLKYGNVKTKGKTGQSSLVYFDVKPNMLNGKPFEKLTINEYFEIINADDGSTAYDKNDTAITGATVSGIAAIKNLNGMVDFITAFISDALTPPEDPPVDPVDPPVENIDGTAGAVSPLSAYNFRKSSEGGLTE